MTVVGFHASHEQFAPSELLSLVALAEEAGFSGAMCSEHIKPWGPSQGQSGFAWSWLGAAMAATRLPFGVISVPGYRYHLVQLAGFAGEGSLAEVVLRFIAETPQA